MKKCVYILCIVAFTFCFGKRAGAAVVADRVHDSGTKHIVRLPWLEKGLSLWVPIPLEGKEVVFRKESDFKGHRIVRGALPTGLTKKDYLCFAVDVTAYKLYLDLNRNLDLTDDRDAVFQGKLLKNKQLDFNIRIDPSNTPLAISYVIDISFDSPKNNLYSVHVISGWQGEIELHGKKWEMTVLDNMDGVIGAGDMLYLFPEGERYSKYTGFSFVYRIPMPENLFFDCHEYNLGFHFETDIGNTKALAVTFTEIDPHMGTINIEGKSIKRLFMYDYASKRRNAVILDSPCSTVSIPVGFYGSYRVVLEESDSPGIFYTDCTQKVYVDTNKTTSLKIGGPLNNEVTVDRGGIDLSMRYRLVGIGKEEYHQQNENPKVTPAFSVYSGRRKIGSGHFRYG